MKIANQLFLSVSALLFSYTGISNAAEFQKADTIKLSIAGDIQDAKRLNGAIDTVSKKVTDCVNNNVAQPSECSCLYPIELKQLKSNYENTLKSHPAWKDHTLLWDRDDSHSYTYSLSLKALRLNVIENKCPTPRSSGTP